MWDKMDDFQYDFKLKLFGDRLLIVFWRYLKAFECMERSGLKGSGGN